MSSDLSPIAQKVQEALAAQGLSYPVVEVPAGAPNAVSRTTPMDTMKMHYGQAVSIEKAIGDLVRHRI